MILIFGGTTEGRIAATICERADKEFFYSTKGSDQIVESKRMVRLSGDMTSGNISHFCKENDIRLIIDSAHPYAANLHRNILSVGLPTIRFDRLPIRHDSMIFDSVDEVVKHLIDNDIDNVLALTGVNSSRSLKNYAIDHQLSLRIMDREESRKRIQESAFPADKVIYYDDTQDLAQLITQLKPSAIITKESGESGGFDRKLELSKLYNIPLLVVERPEIEGFTQIVYGEHGLRRAIEKLVPEYFELHTGFTTGSAATAASVAAVISILDGEPCESVVIELPNGEPYVIDIEECIVSHNSTECCVIKESGDDPDITDGARIRASVELLESDRCSVKICGGSGVGVVTLPGLGIEVGEAAINPVPREMITKNIFNALGSTKTDVKVTISVDNGEQLGAKTFNPRLGIVGGISILGTSGIVTPFSAEAFLESIERQIDIVKALGLDTIVINSGAKSERLVKEQHPDYNPHSYIHYGNLIGATIELAARAGIYRVVVGVMIGKGVKLAEGALDTHSKHGVMNREFIKSLAIEAGCSTSTIEKIATITTARQLWEIIPKDEKKIFELIVQRSSNICKPLLPNGVVEIILLHEGGVF